MTAPAPQPHKEYIVYEHELADLMAFGCTRNASVLKDIAIRPHTQAQEIIVVQTADECVRITTHLIRKHDAHPQHCEHECYYKREIPNQNCNIPRCQYDTRAGAPGRKSDSTIPFLPHTPPTPCEEQGCTDTEQCDEICEHQRIYTEAQMRERVDSARNAVLDLAIGNIEIALRQVQARRSSGKWDLVDATEMIRAAEQYLESLRTPTQEAQQR